MELSAEALRRLRAAHASYPSLESGSFYDEVLDEVAERVKQTNSVGKLDVGALMFWKRLNLSTPWVGELNGLADAEVRGVTQEAIAVARDERLSIPEAARQARTILLALPGCKTGAAVASTILTAGAPARMAVFDTRAVDAVVDLGYDNPGSVYSRYMPIIEDLQKQLSARSDTSWTPRDVDKALFMLGVPSKRTGLDGGSG
jgi:hypothetical protein